LDTGLRLGPGPTAVALTAPEWLERRERLRPRGELPDGPTVPYATGDEWHAFRAFEAEEAGGSESALWHVERQADLRPDGWTLLANRGARHAEAGRFERAAAAYARAEGKASAEGLTDWYRLRAAESMAVRRSDVARWYLDRILAREPDDARAL